MHWFAGGRAAGQAELSGGRYLCLQVFALYGGAKYPNPTPPPPWASLLFTRVLCACSFTSSCCLCRESSISRKHENCSCTGNPVLSGHIRHAMKSFPAMQSMSCRCEHLLSAGCTSCIRMPASDAPWKPWPYYPELYSTVGTGSSFGLGARKTPREVLHMVLWAFALSPWRCWAL